MVEGSEEEESPGKIIRTVKGRRGTREIYIPLTPSGKPLVEEEPSPRFGTIKTTY